MSERMMEQVDVRRAIACAMWAVAGAPAIAWAQEGTRASQEVTVTGGTLMLLSYMALLVLLLGFLALLAVRQGRDRRELEALTRRMDDVLGGER